MDLGKFLLITFLLGLGSLNASLTGHSQPQLPVLTSPVPAARTVSNPPPVTNPLSPDTRQGMSSNWSGYGAVGGTFTAVSGTWTVPTPQTDGTFAADATWVGIGGITATDLIQAGTQAATGPNGQVQYQAFYEVLPDASHPLPVNIKGGDSVTASVAQRPDGQWQISFTDNTTGKSNQMTVSYYSTLSSAEWVEEAPSGMHRLMPLDNFGTVTFTGCQAIENGQTVNVADASAQAILMGLGNQLLATPSGLGNDGGSFTVTRTNSRIQTTNPSQVYRQTMPGFSYF